MAAIYVPGGDVVGPASATADAIVLFDGTTGKAIKSSAKLIVETLGTDNTTVPTSAAVKAVTDLKANDADVVKLTGNQTISGLKTFNNNIGVGTAAVTDSVIKAEGTFTGQNSVIFGFYFLPALQPSASGTAELYGLSAYPQFFGSNNAGTIAGAILRPTINHTGGTLTNLYGLTIHPNFTSVSAGTTTNFRTLYVRNATKNVASTETITTQTQLWLESPTRGTTNWAIYSEGGTSYHAGDFLIGTTVNSGRLTVRGSGTSSAANGLCVEDSAGVSSLLIRNDGGYAFRGGTVGLAQTGYVTFTNLVTDRTCDADATTVEELADILGTLIVDLKTKGIIAG